jgi:transcriptional regulator MraZ
MALFSGTHQQSFDAKGRVSVPASFRAVLREDSSVAGSTGPVPIPLVLRPSERGACIEVWTEKRFDALRDELEKYDPLSDEREILATVLFGDAHVMETDREGRVIIDGGLLRHAHITRPGGIVFVGLGDRFQLWAPDAIEDRKAAARAMFTETFGRKREPAA